MHAYGALLDIHHSLAPIPGGGDEDFVSCGEDGTIRVWKGLLMEENSIHCCITYMYVVGCECQQVIQLPATSVWSVTCNPDGDIVSGSRYLYVCMSKPSSANSLKAICRAEFGLDIIILYY